MVEEFKDNFFLVFFKDFIINCIVFYIILVFFVDCNLKLVFLIDIIKVCIFLYCGSDVFFVGVFLNIIEKD